MPSPWTGPNSGSEAPFQGQGELITQGGHMITKVGISDKMDTDTVAALVSGSHSLRRFGAFLTPEEHDPPTVLRTMQENLDETSTELEW